LRRWWHSKTDNRARVGRETRVGGAALARTDGPLLGGEGAADTVSPVDGSGGVSGRLGRGAGAWLGNAIGAEVGAGVGELVGAEVGGTVGAGVGGDVGTGDGAKVATETPVTSAVLMSRRRESIMNDKLPVEKPTRVAVKHLLPHIVKFTESESLVST
jgi:hypothetical protein